MPAYYRKVSIGTLKKIFSFNVANINLSLNVTNINPLFTDAGEQMQQYGAPLQRNLPVEQPERS